MRPLETIMQSIGANVVEAVIDYIDAATNKRRELQPGATIPRNLGTTGERITCWASTDTGRDLAVWTIRIDRATGKPVMHTTETLINGKTICPAQDDNGSVIDLFDELKRFQEHIRKAIG